MTASINRWGMLAAHVCINFVLGGVYAFSYFKTPINGAISLGPGYAGFSILYQYGDHSFTHDLGWENDR